jgi:hypothetical protein
VFLGERVTVWTIVGFALVLAGSYLVTRRRPDAAAPVAPAHPEAAPIEVQNGVHASPAAIEKPARGAPPRQ